MTMHSQQAPQVPQSLDTGFMAWVSDLVCKHRYRLVGYARKLGLDQEEALDCVQDVFMSFLSSSNARRLMCEQDESLRLLTVMLRNIVSNRRRSIRRRNRKFETMESEPVASGELSAESRVVQAQEAANLGTCIEQLAGLQRTVLCLSLLEGASSDEMAASLNLTPGHVRVLLHRAREQLRPRSRQQGCD